MTESKYGVYPKTEEELLAYLHEQDNKQHDYNTIADSLANVTVAMFNYFASKHGMTGWQASWAGLEFIRKTRGLEAPFGIIDGGQLLYPQYDLAEKLNEWIEEWKPEIGKLAKERLKSNSTFASERVIEHWKKLAQYAED